MKAILFATGQPIAGADPAAGHRPAELLPLGDRPFIRHVIEHLVGHGVREIDVVLSLYPELFGDLLGDGSRWGCRIETRLVRSETEPYGVLRALALDATGTLDFVVKELAKFHKRAIRRAIAPARRMMGRVPDRRPFVDADPLEDLKRPRQGLEVTRLAKMRDADSNGKRVVSTKAYAKTI